MDEYIPIFNKHYIRADERGNITGGWSDGPFPARDTDGYILLTDTGGYQFRLSPDGAENPALTGEYGIYRYRYSEDGVTAKTDEALRAETDVIRREASRLAKLAEMGAACTSAIYAGVTVGEAHYSLTEHDQIELMGQQSAVLAGAAEVPYHADGELCRMYPAAEFLDVADAAVRHIFYHRTYCNHLNAWVKRAGTAEELDGITYGAALPEDLAGSMGVLMGGGGAVS